MTTAQKTTAVVGAAAIGGPFQLVDHRGKSFSDRDLLGGWSLLYFGFTHCPDICPEELEKIVDAKKIAEKATGKKLAMVFISVDPERDTVAQVAQYVKEFDPEMIGLTGTLEQVSKRLTFLLFASRCCTLSTVQPAVFIHTALAHTCTSTS